MQIPVCVVQVVLLLLGHSRANVKALMIFLDSFLRILEISAGPFPGLQWVCFVPTPPAAPWLRLCGCENGQKIPCAGTGTQQLHPPSRAAPADLHQLSNICVSKVKPFDPQGLWFCSVPGFYRSHSWLSVPKTQCFISVGFCEEL